MKINFLPSASCRIIVDGVGILIREGRSGQPINFLCLQGRINRGKRVMITETTKGPLFIAPGPESVMFYNDSPLRKLFDMLGIRKCSDLQQKMIPVLRSKKGFFIVDMDMIARFQGHVKSCSNSEGACS